MYSKSRNPLHWRTDPSLHPNIPYSTFEHPHPMSNTRCPIPPFPPFSQPWSYPHVLLREWRFTAYAWMKSLWFIWVGLGSFLLLFFPPSLSPTPSSLLRYASVPHGHRPTFESPQRNEQWDRVDQSQTAFRLKSGYHSRCSLFEFRRARACPRACSACACIWLAPPLPVLVPPELESPPKCIHRL